MIDDLVLRQVQFADRNVLEIGCGSGKFTLAHLTKARSILGIDPSAEAIATLQANWAAQTSNATVDFRQGNIVDFPLPPSRFDIAVFSRSL